MEMLPSVESTANESSKSFSEECSLFSLPLSYSKPCLVFKKKIIIKFTSLRNVLPLLQCPTRPSFLCLVVFLPPTQSYLIDHLISLDWKELVISPGYSRSNLSRKPVNPYFRFDWQRYKPCLGREALKIDNPDTEVVLPVDVINSLGS